MLSSSSAIFGSLKFLFQEQSSKGSQALPDAPFSLTGAVSGGNAFASPLAPDQQPKKRKIYLNCSTIFQSLDPTKIALTIAKLKEADFEVAIIQNDKDENIFASSIEDKAEGDKKYDYKFKDKNGKEIGIFELSDDFIKENSFISDDEDGIKKLGLVRDESIILTLYQFHKINNFFSQNYSYDKEGVSVRSHLNYKFLEGAKKIQTYEDIKESIKIEANEPSLLSKNITALINHENFDINNPALIDDLKVGLKLAFDFKYFRYDPILESLGEEKLVRLFDIVQNTELNHDQSKKNKENISKKILCKLWCKHPDFDLVVKKAKTLDEFKDKDHEKIARDLQMFAMDNSFSLIDKKSSHSFSDISKRLHEDDIFINLIHSETSFGGTHPSILSFIAKQQEAKTSFGDKIKTSFAVEEIPGQADIWFQITLDYNPKLLKLEENQLEFFSRLPKGQQHLESNSIKIEVALQDVINLISNPEINQHFSLNEQFGDKIIELLRQETLSKICGYFTSFNYPEFLKHLNDNQKTQFIDLLQNKIEELDKNVITRDNCDESVLSILQYNLDQPKILEFTESALNKLSNKETSSCYLYFEFFSLVPEFQDLLFKMHISGEINLNKIILNKDSKLYIKYKELESESSQDSTTSPLQITLLNLNEEFLERIETEITSGELDANKILSINVSRIGKGDSVTENTKKEHLLTKFVALFPNLKHAEIDIKDIPEFDRKKLQSERFILKIYNSSQSFEPPVNFQPILSSQQTQPRFEATKNGDAIFIGNAEGSGANKKDTPTTFSMKETGKIIQRPANTTALYIRDTSHKMNPNFVALEDNLFVDIDESQAILSEEIRKFSLKDFEAKKTELEKGDSQDKTICSFSKTLESGKKTALPSISPDNKIIGYYTDPPSANVEFLKDESGFYYAKSNQNCAIHYIIEGKELELKKVNDPNLKDLDPKVTKIIDDYVGNKESFPLSVENDQYNLPGFSSNKKFLDDLFNIDNKGSCRHRVASLAHKFEQNGFKFGTNYRIISVNGNHVLLEVKKQDSDEWINLDLGGSASILKEVPQSELTSQTLSAPIILPDQLSMISSRSSPDLSQLEIEGGSISFLAFCVSCLGLGVTIKNTQSIKVQSDLVFDTQSAQPSSELNNPNLISLTELIKSQNLAILESALAELRQLPEIEDLKSFSESLEQFVTNKDSSSLYLKTTNSEELKNYLLRMSIDSQDSLALNQGSSISTPTSPALTTSTLSFGAFYISSPQDLTVKKSTIHVKNRTKDLAITDDTPLFSFLQNATQNTDKQHVLIIDWWKFDASSQVAFNTMFDQADRKIDGAEIPDNVKIICIDDSKQKTLDSSILSRFGQTLDVSPIKKEDLKLTSPSEALSNIETIAFDGEGFADWREKLFGRFVVNGAKMEWQKSDFVESLEAFGTTNSDSNLQLDFKNFSAKQQQEMKIFFAQAQASGLINYHDYEIKIPRSLTLNFAKKEFKFENVLQSFASLTQDSQASSSPLPITTPTLKIYKDVQASQSLPQDIHLINSQLFDQLLIQPKIEGSKYIEEVGLIEQASKSSKTLKLYLSEDLSSQQFYCLLNQAQKHQVSLELSLAKGVKIPDQGFAKFVENKSITQENSGAGDSEAGDFSAVRVSKPTITSPTPPSPTPPRITITNNIEDSLNSLKKSLPSAQTINIVNVEDILYGDLFGKNQHKLVSDHDAQHFAFEKIESDLKAKLDKGEPVILKGEFSAELLSLLHPQILDLQKKYSNLYFIIEDKNVSKSRPQSSKLSWLDPSLYEVKHSPEATKIDKKIAGEETTCVEDEISADSKVIADAFIKGRKEKLSEFLQENPILQIFGHSGVGKSSLLRDLKENGLATKGDEKKVGFAVYNELSGLEAWSQDTSDKTKILVIDEFNVDGSTNFTMFRDLANNPKTFPQTIFHDGKSYELDASHKVVFLGNPPNYGNRFKQKLFEDCQIPEWHLQDFPVDYIYEDILKTPIYDGCSGDIKTKINEEEFKKIAIKQIKTYKAKNQGLQSDDGLPTETVRELQEKVLKEIVKKISPIDASQVQNANFIATPSNQQSINELQSAIQIRQLQKQGELPSQYLGTCGVIFEGDSGVGKSVMIEAVLKERGITKIDSLEALEQQIETEKSSGISPATKPHYYYKIPASLPIQEIEENLIKAFELGVIVVFDEMNTRIKEGGLEKTINQLLTGQHPKNSEIKSQPGFMLIASVNKATNAGRSAFSPAIKHRCNIISAKSLSEYTQEDFEKIIGNWVKNDGISFAEKPDTETVKEVAKEFGNLVKENCQYNLRDLKSKLPQIIHNLNEKKLSENPVAYR